MEIFNTKIDLSLLLIISSIAFISIIAALVTLHNLSLFNILGALLILSIGAALPLWILLSTYYVVGNNQLKILSGPFSWKIPISSIQNIREANHPFCQPTFSHDQLAIYYEVDKIILVSPANKKGFITAINQ